MELIIMSEEAKKTFEQKNFKVEGLGEVTRRVNGDFNMSQGDLNKFFADNGIPEYAEFKKAEEKAIDQLTESAAKFLAEQSIADDRDTTLKCGLGNGRIVVSHKQRTEGKNPRTGEATERFGVVSVKIQHSVPKRLAEEGGVLDTIAKDVEAAWKKIHG